MKKVILIIISIIITSFLPVYGQDPDVAKAMKEINNIKLDGKYIWAEGTAKTKKEALENAQAVLTFEIQNWLRDNGKTDVAGVVMPSNDQCMKIQTMRRSLHRAFVYVEKNAIMPYNKGEKVIVVEKNEGKKEKAKDVDKKQELKSIYEDIYTPSAFEKAMLDLKKSDDIEDFVNRPDILRHGEYKDRPAIGVYHIFIYNKEGRIPACLKYSEGKLTNLATGKEDSFDNYKGCGGYWVIEKK